MSYPTQQHGQPGSQAAARPAEEDDLPSLHAQEQPMGASSAQLELPGAGLTPLDFIHWLYLQPPADAEVLVQACGRSFVTSWDPIQQHWLTHELPEGVGRVPGLLPRVTHVDVPCLCVRPPSTQRRSLQQPAQSNSRSTTTSQPCHKLLLYGTGLDAPGSSFAACLHGNYLHVESRLLPAPLLTQSSGDSNNAAAAAAAQQCSISSGLAAAIGGSPAADWNQQAAAGAPGLISSSLVAQECLELAVYGITQPGLLQLECWCGRLLTCRKQVAVVTAPAVQLELSMYFSVNTAGVEHSTDGNPMAALDFSGASFLMDSGPANRLGHVEDRKVDDLMTDLGCWVDFVGGMQQLCRCFGTTEAQLQAADAPATLAFLQNSQGRSAQLDLSQPLLQACLTQAYRQQMVDTAVQLLAHACSCAWVETADSLLKELLRFGLTFKDIKQKAQSASSSSLLHRAVCSKSPRMIRLVWDWGVVHGPEWTWAEADPGNGITPLHMAAALDAQLPPNFLSPQQRLLTTNSTGRLSSVGSTLADWILQEYQAAYQYWHGAEDCRGMTPADVAELHSMQPTPSSSVDQLPVPESPSSPTLAGVACMPGPGIAPFGSNFDSLCGSATAEDRVGNGGTSITGISRRPSDPSSLSPTAATVEPGHSRLVRSALEPAGKPPAPTTSASVQSWVALQQQLAASQQQPLGPPELNTTANDLQAAGRSNTDDRVLAATALAPEGAQGPRRQQVAPQGHRDQTARPQVPEGGSGVAGGSERISDYQALVTAIQSGRYRGEGQQQNGQKQGANAEGTGQEGPHFGHILAAGPSAAALTSSSSGRTLAGSGSGSGRKPSDMQRLTELLTMQQLLWASLSEFRSRRLEQGYLGWLQTRRLSIRQLLPTCMLGLVLLVLVGEVWRSATAPQQDSFGGAGRLLTVVLYALPWLWLWWSGNSKLPIQEQEQQQRRHRANSPSPSRRSAAQVSTQLQGSRLPDEQVWLLIMLWYLFFRSLQAAGVLALAASTPVFLRAGGDCLTEGFVQVLFQVRTRHVALVRVLYVLSSTALYMRLHVFPSPIHALLVAGFGNLVCLLAAWALDVTNRKAYLQHLLVQLQSSSHEKQSGPRVSPLRPRGDTFSVRTASGSQRRVSGPNNSRNSGSSRLRPRGHSSGAAAGPSNSIQAQPACAPQPNDRGSGAWLRGSGSPRNGAAGSSIQAPVNVQDVPPAHGTAAVQGSTSQGEAAAATSQGQPSQHQQNGVTQVAASRGAKTPTGGHLSQARRRAGALTGALVG